MSVIDDKLVRRYREMIEFGVFDHPPAMKELPAREHGEVARRIAEAGIVLLKNDGHLLPLNSSIVKTIALVGPYAMNASTGGGGSSHVVPLYTVDPETGLRNRASQIKVITNDGSDLSTAASLAKSADVAIVMVGDMDREGRDQSLGLAGNQNDLVAAVGAANPKSIVLLKTGSAVLMPWLGKVAAVLEAWYPGEEDGNAVAAVLFGDVNPPGKLPITFPRRAEDTPANTPEQYPGVNKVAHYSEGVFVGYRHYDAKNIEPLFPFGYGLSYTTFAYSNLRVSPQRATADNIAVDVEVDVSNSGKVSGAEIVQLYLGHHGSDAIPQVPKQLKGFKKVELKPGQKASLQFKLDARAFSYWDTASHVWKVDPGNYDILIASSSRDIRLRRPLEVTGPK
jgi:beta-glucosidase